MTYFGKPSSFRTNHQIPSKNLPELQLLALNVQQQKSTELLSFQPCIEMWLCKNENKVDGGWLNHGLPTLRRMSGLLIRYQFLL